MTIVATNPFTALIGGTMAPQAAVPAAMSLAGAVDFALAVGTVLTPSTTPADAPLPGSSTDRAPHLQAGSPGPLADLAIIADGPPTAKAELPAPSEASRALAPDLPMGAPTGLVALLPGLERQYVVTATATNLAEAAPSPLESASDALMPAELEPELPSLPSQPPIPANTAAVQPLAGPVQPALLPSAPDAGAPEESTDAEVGVDAAARPAAPQASTPAIVRDRAVVTGSPEQSRSPSSTMVEAGVPREPATPQGSPPSFAERLTASLTANPTPSAPASDPATPGAPALASVPIAGATATAPDAPVPPALEVPTVTARPGRIGQEMGVEIARRLSAGGEELTVRLNPAEMGRIEVRLSFDERGSLRAVVAAESTAALEMLRRDSADLGRTLTDAGVRADAQSFRFDGRSGDGAGGQFWQRQQGGGDRRRTFSHESADAASEALPIYRRLGTNGRVDLMA